MSKQLVVIAHNIRSAHNIGALLRTTEGLGVTKLYITGYTPYPSIPNDTRLPHIASRLTDQIHKTALGAELSMDWEQVEDVQTVIESLKAIGFTLAGLEQVANSTFLHEVIAPDRLALLLGSEVTGIDDDVLKQMDLTIEIPMHGKKESFNVVEAASMAMYTLML